MTNEDVLRKVAASDWLMDRVRLLVESEARLAAVIIAEALDAGGVLSAPDVYALFACRDSLNAELAGRLAAVRAAYNGGHRDPDARYASRAESKRNGLARALRRAS